LSKNSTVLQPNLRGLCYQFIVGNFGYYGCKKRYQTIGRINHLLGKNLPLSSQSGSHFQIFCSNRYTGITFLFVVLALPYSCQSTIAYLRCTEMPRKRKLHDVLGLQSITHLHLYSPLP